MKLKKHTFGRTDIRVSELCLGASTFARYADQDESFAMLDAFRAAGGNFFQTNGICPGAPLGDGLLGMPEELVGRWLRERKLKRDTIVIATRIALTRPVIGGVETYTKLIRACAEDSIRRLSCGFLDFLVVEWTDAILPLPESVAALEAVVSSGEARHIVPANFSPWCVLEAFETIRHEPCIFAGLQLDYSLAVRSSFAASMVKICADRDLGAIAHSPLAGGHLAKRALGWSIGALRARALAERRAAASADAVWPALSAVARSWRASAAQIALAWVIAHPQITSVLITVRSADQLRELLDATRLSLTETDFDQLGSDPQRRTRAALPV